MTEIKAYFHSDYICTLAGWQCWECWKCHNLAIFRLWFDSVNVEICPNCGLVWSWYD